MEKRICVIAHDSMKPTLVAFLKEREQWMWNRKFVATGLTAEFMEQESMQLQLEAMVNRDEIAMVLFFRDPEIVQDYEADVVSLVRACIKQNIPLASNPASAELLIIGMIRMEAGRK